MPKFLISCVALLFAASAMAQTTSSTGMQPPRTSASYSGVAGTRLVLLGTAGGPITHTARSQPASLLIVDGRPYLIDCGDGTVRQLKLAGFDAPQVNRLFLTHLHFDHVAGLSSLIGFNWVAGDRQPLEIFGPSGTSNLVHQALEYLQIPEDLYSFQFPPHPKMADITHPHDFDTTTPKLVYQDEKVRVTAVENSHYATMRVGRQAYGPIKSYAYRFETPDRVIVFTGDTGPSRAVEQLVKGADILVSEIIDLDAVKAYMRRTQGGATEEQLRPILIHQEQEHLSPTEVGKLAKAAGVKMVVLTHLSPSDDVGLDTLRYTSGVREVFKGIVVAGRDLDQF